MKIIVTGGAGFLGRFVVQHLRDEGHQTTPIDIIGNEGIKADLSIYSHAYSALAQIKPDAVIHLAALAGATGKGGGAESLKNPYDFFKVNTLAALNVFEACRRLHISKVECMSSFAPYGRATCPIRENTPLNPLNPYAASKVNVETIAKLYAQCYGIKTLIFRAPLICGETQREMNALREFVASALKGEQLVVWGDGSTLREFVHPSDVARAYSLGLDYLKRMKQPYCVFVLGNSPVSMKDLASKIISIVGNGKLELLKEKPRLFNQWTKRNKVELKLGWFPKVGINEIIRKVVADMKN